MSTEIAVREKPILFSGEMVRAILEGRKTQTRRVIRNPERLDGFMLAGEEPDWCPYGKLGDRLWVRETWADYDYATVSNNGVGRGIASRTIFRADDGSDLYDVRWRPSIFMPRTESRITLEITDVRVQRVQEIDDADVAAEGIQWQSTRDGSQAGYIASTPRPSLTYFRPRHCFWRTWNSINEKRGYSWESNPFVWCLTFTRLEQSECGR